MTGHMKGEHRMGRNHMAGIAGDANNTVLAAAGYNFRHLLAWQVGIVACLLVLFATGEDFSAAGLIPDLRDDRIEARNAGGAGSS